VRKSSFEKGKRVVTFRIREVKAHKRIARFLNRSGADFKFFQNNSKSKKR
jgi:hypothetical protein